MGSDKLTWTFDLRKGVKFHDGTPFNADAVEFQFKRLLTKDYVNHASGSGPFIMSKYVDGQVMELTPNPE